MRIVKSFLLFGGIFGLFLGPTTAARSGGGPAPGDECCVVVNPGGGALAMKGTMALVYDEDDDNMDITLRLERSGDQHFFRLNTQGISLVGLTDEGIACLVLNPNETGNQSLSQKVTEFVNEILGTFFVGLNADNTRLVITRSSISDTQGVLECSDEDGNPVHCLIPGTNRTSSLGDITVYAVDKAKADLENPQCQ